MWLIYALIHVFLLSVVSYTDEHLATNNKLPENSNIHTRVGSVLIMSTLMCFVGAGLLYISTRNISINPYSLTLTILSSITMVSYWASYFYLLQEFPANKVGPIYQLGSIWLLLIELSFGGSIGLLGLLGIIILIYGAYILDTGSFSWQIPTNLLKVALPATSAWAITLFLVKTASHTNSAVAVYFWQLIFTGIIGIIFLMFISRYRQGFLFRIKNQGKIFLGLSAVNETFSETSYLFSALAISIAPVAAYVSSMLGVQGVFLFILMYFFPLGDRSRVTKVQAIAVALITTGVFLIKL